MKRRMQSREELGGGFLRRGGGKEEEEEKPFKIPVSSLYLTRTDESTDLWMDRWTDTASYRVACN